MARPGQQTGVAVAEVRAEMVANVWKKVAAEGDVVQEGDLIAVIG